MVEITTDVGRLFDVTYVRGTVKNTRRTTQTVRLESRLDGPTWPPRCGPTISPEWSTDGWEGTIRPGRCRGVGFASPAPPVDRPLELVSAERADPKLGRKELVLADIDPALPSGYSLKSVR